MINMKKFKLLGLSLLFAGLAHAQDANEAKKAVDAEQYQKAKNILKSLIASNPQDGKNYFYLGDIYLTQAEPDSAAIYFNKGKAVKDNPEYNNIGLGRLDLDNGNAAGAQAKFDAIEKELRKKDVEQLIHIGRAYIYSEKPDYKKAIAWLNKAIAKDAKSAQAYLNLGEAQYRDKNQNEAYKSFQTAYNYDNTVLRAKLQLGVLKKNTKAAFPEAVAEFNAIVGANPNYGPAYRELAETYYLWGSVDRQKYAENTKKAIEYYEKYMSLTDYSLNSRMRHADFLVLAGDYKALEAEAQKMQQLDGVNPKILRYLAYSAYENGNYEESLKAMNDFIAKADPKRIIARDYLYLGLAKMALTVSTDAEGNSVITDQAKFDEAIADIKKASEMNAGITTEFSNIGQKLFKQKLYAPAAVVFELATLDTESSNLFVDTFYMGFSIYADHTTKSPEAQKANLAALIKADSAFAKVIELNPKFPEAHLYKAKTDQKIGTNESLENMAKAYDGYIVAIIAKGPADIEKNKKSLIEAYENAGAYYAVKDKAKAKEYFAKALELDPADEYAKQELQKLNK
jgi:tetratricopeptide (TPR) repeat protein